MDEKIKTCTLRFPAKENPNMEKALFDWSIVSQYDVKAKYRLISRNFLGVFSSERPLNQLKATRVCIRSTNQSNRSIFVSLMFLFCSRVFISRSYENRSNNLLLTIKQTLKWKLMAKTTQFKMKKRKRAEKTERDFRWSICRSAIGQVGFRSACAVVIFVALSLLNLSYI